MCRIRCLQRIPPSGGTAAVLRIASPYLGPSQGTSSVAIHGYAASVWRGRVADSMLMLGILCRVQQDIGWHGIIRVRLSLSMGGTLVGGGGARPLIVSHHHV